MKLYYMRGACSLVPHVALEWIGEPYEMQAMTGESSKTPEYLALNPQGAVPLLADGDFTLSQNVAILSYLDACFPQAKLFGSDSLQGKAEAFRWLAFLNSDLHKAFGPLFHLPEYASAEPVKSAAQNAARANILKMLGVANDRLNGRDYLGENISVADVYLYVILRWCKALALDYSSLAQLEPFYQRIAANAGLQAAVEKEGLTV